MKKEKVIPATIDEYITGFPEDIQKILQEIRAIIHEAAPQATEAISWSMPTYKLNGNLVHFTGNKKHVGFYPSPDPIVVFANELKDYKTSKGAIQFPYDKPLPADLIRRIVEFRVKANTGV